jgi:hypothetical protein
MEKLMASVLMYGLLVIAIIGVAVLIYLIYPTAIRVLNIERRKAPSQALIKRDWLPTGRIDFATQLTVTASAKSNDQPSEFRLLVEERRIVESIAGNENLEIQWRLATLKEAKAVVTQYHNYLSENSLIKSVIDDTASSPPPTARSSPSPVSSATGSLVAAAPHSSHEPDREIQTDRPSAQ